MILTYCIKAKKCTSIMLWVTGGVWPYVCQRSEAVEHAVLRQLLLQLRKSMFITWACFLNDTPHFYAVFNITLPCHGSQIDFAMSILRI